MYCRPMTVMFNDFPFGGSLRSALAYSRPLLPTRWSSVGLEWGGLSIEDSCGNVSTASASRTTPAATVQPTSRRVLPRICAATAPLRARNRSSVYPSTPSTPMKITSATYSVILYRLSIWFALGDPPDWGVKNASSDGIWPKAAEILFRPARDALDDVCHEGA